MQLTVEIRFISLGNECGDGGYGGAIYSGGNVALKNSTITGSKAGNGAYGSDPFLGLGGNGGSGGHGGAIFATGAVTLTSSSISGCFGGDAGDGGEDDPILGGEGMGGAGGSGGAIYATGTVTLISSTVTDSHAGNGGSREPTRKSVLLPPVAAVVQFMERVLLPSSAPPFPAARPVRAALVATTIGAMMEVVVVLFQPEEW